jgi:FtsH-binding integral membrane protein
MSKTRTEKSTRHRANRKRGQKRQDKDINVIILAVFAAFAGIGLTMLLHSALLQNPEDEKTGQAILIAAIVTMISSWTGKTNDKTTTISLLLLAFSIIAVGLGSLVYGTVKSTTLTQGTSLGVIALGGAIFWTMFAIREVKGKKKRAKRTLSPQTV